MTHKIESSKVYYRSTRINCYRPSHLYICHSLKIFKALFRNVHNLRKAKRKHGKTDTTELIALETNLEKREVNSFLPFDDQGT